MTPLLEIDALTVDFPQPGWRSPKLRAVDDVTIAVDQGETVGLVGESGSGKSTIARSVLGLVRPSSGRVRFAGQDMSALSAAARRAAAADLQVVFQDPYSSLNPMRRVGQALAEPLEVQRRLSRGQATAEIGRLLARVGLPHDAAHRYPHRFSGGQRQRIAIARALSLSPRLIVCDEPVSALDVSTQAQVLTLLAELQEEFGLAYLFIAHNLAVVRHVAHRIVVLYGGRTMETGPAAALVDHPQHPYTRALLAAVPVTDPGEQRRRRERRAARPAAQTPARPAPRDGCLFAPRCPHAAEVCWRSRPALRASGPTSQACHLNAPDSGHPEAAAVGS